MSNLKDLQKQIDSLSALLEMAFPRDKFIDKVRNILVGALQEYSKYRYALLLSAPTSTWPAEVKMHLKRASKILKEAETKGDFNRLKAFDEALKEAMLYPEKVLYGKNYILKIHPGNDYKLKKIYSAEALFRMMFEEFGDPRDVVKPKYKR